MSWLYLPIEISVRELHAKSLLAAVAAENGWRVVLGPKTALDARLGWLPSGTVFQFGLHANFAANSYRMRNQGHYVVAVDEEGLVTLDSERYRRYRVSHETLAATDLCLCWGANHRDMLQPVVEGTGCRLEVTGNPRIDLLRSELQQISRPTAEILRQRYGRFVLINSNFGSFNHQQGIDYTFTSLKAKGWMETPEDESFHRKRISLQGDFFRAFQVAIPELISAGHQIIVRPHPSESLAPWQKLVDSLPSGRLHVIHEGGVVPWLMAADAVVHNGCTTAVEAFVLGRPVFSYRPKCDPNLESELPNRISIQVHSVDELLEGLKDPQEADNRDRDQRMRYAAKFISGLDGATAAQQIFEQLPAGVRTGGHWKGSGFGLAFGSRVQFWREVAARMLGRRGAANDYVKFKCHDISRNELEPLLQSIQGAMGLQNQLNLRDIGGGLWLVEQ